MKTYRATTGPFSERPFYKLEDIERICSDELRAVSLYPEKPEPIRIERFIEKRFQVTPTYDDLPDGILGYTKFGSKGVQEMVVSRKLSEDGTQSAERRTNTTIAHEGGHCLLHAHLFILGNPTNSLFGDFSDPDAPKVLCRDESIPSERSAGASYDGRWWEYQANKAIGGLLLPRDLVRVTLEPFMVPRGLLGFTALPEESRQDAIRTIADTFDVNPRVARIRLSEMFPVESQDQLML